MTKAEKRLEGYSKLVATYREAANTNGVAADLSPEGTAKRKASALKDYNFFIRTYFPGLAPCDCAPFHIRIADTIAKYKRLRLALELFRGAAKSSTLQMVLIWLMVRGEKFYCLLTSANYSGAEGLLDEIRAALDPEANPLFAHDWGNQQTYGSWSADYFVTQSGCIFEAIGAGQKPRGKKHFGLRPNMIICDDMDDDEMVLNDVRVRKAFRWMTRALMMTMGMGEGRFIVANNRIHPKGLLARTVEWIEKLQKSQKAKRDSDTSDRPTKALTRYEHIKVNALNAKGESEWPAAYSTQQILETIEELGYAGSQQELFNNPIIEGELFKHDWFRWIKARPGWKYEALCAYCDPSWTDNGDFKAIRLWGKASSKEVVLLWSFVRQCSRASMVKAYYDLHELLMEKGVFAQYWIEGSFNQKELLADFEIEGEERGYQLNIRLDVDEKPDKYTRIAAEQSFYERGFYYFAEHLKDDPDTETGNAQILAFDKGSGAHDDAPDADQGAHAKLGLYKPRAARGLETRFGQNHPSPNVY
jgi:predicted phage terminase large subunit-like protein